MNCSVDQCKSPVRTAGYCQKHYLRVWRYGDPSVVKLEKIGGTLRERFEARVIKNPEGCWGWQGAKATAGYGNIRYDHRVYLVHRLSYEIHFGPIPDGMVICHRCDNPICSNPDHLFVGTQQDNMIDMKSKGRKNSPSKLSNSDVVSIKELIREGCYSDYEIGKRFSVSNSTIRMIRIGRAHKTSLPIPGRNANE